VKAVSQEREPGTAKREEDKGVRLRSLDQSRRSRGRAGLGLLRLTVLGGNSG